MKIIILSLIRMEFYKFPNAFPFFEKLNNKTGKINGTGLTYRRERITGTGFNNITEMILAIGPGRQNCKQVGFVEQAISGPPPRSLIIDGSRKTGQSLNGVGSARKKEKKVPNKG